MAYDTTDNGYSVQFAESMRMCSDGQIRGVFETADGDAGVVISGDFIPDAVDSADEDEDEDADVPELKYRIEKRVANTDKWGTVGYADSRENAVDHAHNVEGGRSTGVRIVALDPAEGWREGGSVEVIVGC